MNSKEAPANVKSPPKWLLYAIASASAAIIVFISILLYESHTIDMDDYIIVEFNGYNTIGSAKATFDEQTFWNEVEKKQRKMIKMSVYGSSVGIENFLQYDLSPSNGLSNGDLIYLKWKVDDDWIKDPLIVHLKYHDKVYVVNGLLDLESTDPSVEVNE